MTDPVFSTEGKLKLSEGMILEFKVLNIVKLQDGRDYYILEDPNCVKHFIDAEFYANYGIAAGNKLSCKVAKINCTGRIILEPMHPIYSEGQNYYFELVFSEVINGNIQWVVEDIFKNKIELIIPKPAEIVFQDLKFIKCRVIRLRKGVPEIEIVT
jgi:hypothetical protein